jgi:hypothetical protein
MKDFIGDCEGSEATHHNACDCREAHFKELEEENKGLLQWIADLQSGMYINCVYCGHRYPPGTPDVRDDVLYEHIKKCPKHPLSKALNEIEKLKALIERYKVCWGFHDLETLRQALKKEKDEKELTDYII